MYIDIASKKRFMIVIFPCVCIFVLVGVLTVLAAPGDLDPTFGMNGKVTTVFMTSGSEGRDIALQPDGKIVVAGNVITGGIQDFGLARYHSDGSLDITFDNDGLVTTDIELASDDYVGSLVLQPDGKMIVAGYTAEDGFSEYNFALARYHIDGSLDTSFDSDGKVVTSFSSTNDDGILSVALQADGKIVVAGFVYDDVNGDDFALARYNSDGSLDTTFDGDGKVSLDFDNGRDTSSGVIIQPDGKIVVAGSAVISATTDIALVRYLSDGSLDSSFGGNGTVTTDLGGSYDTAYSLALQPDGKIVVVGGIIAGSVRDFLLLRYHSDGSLDTTFDGDGIVTTDFEGRSDTALDVEIEADGKIIVGGRAGVGSQQSDFGLARYNSDGSLDTTFDDDGKVTTHFHRDVNVIHGLQVQPDGKIVAAGRSANPINLDQADFVLARYLTAPNQPPQANDDMFVGDEDTAMTTGNVLANDSDPDGDPLSVVGLHITDTVGLVTDNGDGTFVYDPNSQFEWLAAGAATIDTFAYTISDGNDGTATAVITITVSGLNDSPLAEPDTAVTLVGTAVVIPVLDNDSDVDATDVLTITAVMTPTNGAAVVNGNTILYTPSAGFTGSEQFMYTISDGIETASATVTVTIEGHKVFLPMIVIDN